MSNPSLISATAEDGLPPEQRRKAIIVILLGLILTVLDGTIVIMALPRIASDFGAPASDSVWVVTAYQLAVLGLLLPMASLGERIGFHKVYMAGMLVFGITSLLCALSQNLWQLAALRAVQGAAGAAVMGVNAALVRQTYPSSLLGRGIALNAMVVAVSSLAGPSIAALVLSLASWQWLFALSVPLVVLNLRLAHTALPRNLPEPGSPPLSPIDVLLNISAFALFFWAVDALTTRGFAHSELTQDGIYSSAILLFSLFLWVWYVSRQRRLERPLLPLDLLRLPVFTLSLCASVMAFCGQMLTFIALPFLTLSILHYSPLKAGLLISIWPISLACVAVFAGRLIGRVSSALLGGIGMTIMACGLASFSLLPVGAPMWAMAMALAAAGMGFGLFQSPNNHLILTTGPRNRSGVAGGMLGTARLTGQSLGAALSAGVFAIWPPPQDLGGPSISFGLAAAAAMTAAVISLLRMRCRPGHQPV